MFADDLTVIDIAGTSQNNLQDAIVKTANCCQINHLTLAIFKCSVFYTSSRDPKIEYFVGNSRIIAPTEGFPDFARF